MKRHEWTVPDGVDDERLDRFLARMLPELSRTAVARLASEGRVRVREAQAPPSRRLRPGDSVTCDIPETAPATLEAEALPLQVLHEDESLVVIDKAPGMVVHPGAGRRSGTLVNALLHRYGGGLLEVGGEERPGIVHRLDAGTSGVMVIARTSLAHARLSAQFAARQVEKEYRAVVVGAPGNAGRVEAPIGRSVTDRKRMSTSAPRSRAARTDWTLVEAFGGSAALLAVRLHTGRTHQVRVHLASVGHPVVGDAAYGAEARVLQLRDRAAATLLSRFERPALHALRLAFDHPATGERVEFLAPLPADVEGLLAALRRGTG